MLIRLASMADLPEFARIYDAAKAYMRASGNPNQWNSAYPEQDTLKKDIARRQLYAMEENGAVHGVFALIPGEEPSYRVIDGAWLNNAPYATIHRIASDGGIRHVFKQCADYAKARYENVRVDTHADNKTMQHVVEKAGFVRCGIVELPGIGPRIAYHYAKEEQK